MSASPCYYIEHQARLAGEAAYLAGDACDLTECEARCAEQWRLAALAPSRSYRLFAFFIEGFNDMAACLDAYGFDREGRDIRARVAA